MKHIYIELKEAKHFEPIKEVLLKVKGLLEYIESDSPYDLIEKIEECQ